MKLSEEQQKFAHALALLILKANEMGYEVTLGEAWRPQWVAEEYERQGKGIKNSFHTIRLAIDLNLFKDGKYLTATLDYKPVGEAWESLGGTWGGRFRKRDGNHFSWGE